MNNLHCNIILKDDDFYCEQCEVIVDCSDCHPNGCPKLEEDNGAD